MLVCLSKVHTHPSMRVLYRQHIDHRPPLSLPPYIHIYAPQLLGVVGEGVEEHALEVREAALGPHVRPPLQLRDLFGWLFGWVDVSG